MMYDAQTTRRDDQPLVAHTGLALKSVVEHWSHTHATNPDGNVICVPCMAEILLKIHEMVYKDCARTADGKLVVT